MKKHKLFLTFLLSALMLGCFGMRATVQAAPVVATSVNNPALSLTYDLVNVWNSGFTGKVVIKNSSSSTVLDWNLNFELPANISSIWGATITVHDGTSYSLAPVPWTKAVPANGSVSFGFVAQTADGNEMSAIALVDPSMPTVTPEGDEIPAETTEPVFTVTEPPAYTSHGPSLQASYNYGKALQMAWYFYEAQRSGPLPKVDGDLAFNDPVTGATLHDGFRANRIPWRGDSDLKDGADVGLDLTGGWHDAGDHVKFGLPMAFSASFLAWGVLEFEDALRETGQLDWAKDNLRWVADYFVRAHPEPNVLYGQVGLGAVDHTIWGPPEVMPHVRPAFKIDLAHPGPDLAAQTAAALTAISLVFKDDEPVYAATLLRHAKELYDFAQNTRAPETSNDSSLGRYSDSITDAKSFYCSRSGAKDDLPFAAAWLYKATKNSRYLHDAEADYTRIADREGHHGWTAVWDDVRYGVYMLMAEIYSDPDYKRDSLITPEQRHDGYFDYNLHAQNFLNFWLRDGGVQRTPGGMAYLTTWGSARYNTVTAFLALVYRKHLIAQNMGPQLQDNYLKFATEQLNYVLGANPLHMSYEVGYGDLWSQVAHHRASHGSSTNNMYNPVYPRHILYGGLAGGPRLDDSYTDDRADFALTEVADDMNAGFAGALAGLVDAYGIAGNEADPDFPPPAPREDEMFVRATLKTNQPTTLATTVVVDVVNESAYPPRASDGLMFRYFVDLSEVFKRGFTLDDVIVELYQNEGAGATLKRWKDSAYIFCVEGSFVGTNIVPIGTVEKKKTIQFIIRLPWAQTGWDPTNDPSYEGLVGGTAVKTRKIALYDTNLPEGEQLVWGEEPDPGILQSELPPPGSDDDTAAAAAANFTVSPNVYSAWATGYCAKFTVTNSGDTVQQPLGFQFTLPASVTFTTSWNGTITRNGDIVDVALPTWIGLMQPGQSRTDFGYCAAGTVQPSMTVEEENAKPESTTPTAHFDVACNAYSQWATGYCTKCTVTNSGEVAQQPQGFRLTLPAGVPITTSWNGNITRNGDIVDVDLPSWVGVMQPGQSRTDFGFCAAGTTTPVVVETGDEPVPASNVSDNISVTAAVYNIWANGYCVTFTVSNSGVTGADPQGIAFTLPAGVEIANSWNLTVSRDGDTASAQLPDWLGMMEPGASRSDFGFCATGTEQPTALAAF